MTDVLWLHEVSKENIDSVGEKAAYLGELIQGGLPVPPGFVVSTEAYKEAFSGIEPEVKSVLESVNIQSLESLNSASDRIKGLFLNIDPSESLKKEVSKAYEKMFAVPEEYKDVQKKALDFIRAGRDRPFLMLRSSPTISTISQQASFLDTNGVQDILNKIKLCWASLFSTRAIYYRKKKNIENPNMAVIIQQRPNLLKSGSVLGVNPLTNKKNQILIQARWGFSQKNAEESDIYIYDTQLRQIESKLVSNQKTLHIFDSQVMKVARRDTSDELKGVELLSNKELEIIDSAVRKVNSLFKFPQDLEWGFAKGKFFILQSRPITSLIEKPILAGDNNIEATLKGMPVSAGNFKGAISLTPKPGCILLARSLDSNVFRYMFGASALIVEKGDFKSLPAVIARELEIPCIVRANNATSKLQEGQEISMDAFSGKIYWEQALETQPVTNAPVVERPLEPASEPISVVLDKLSNLETTITELVLQDAQRRRDSQEVDEQKSKLISELEWEVRSLREKVEKALRGDEKDTEPETLL